MPAQTNNTSILKAANQIVQALLDQIAETVGCGDVTVNVAAPNVTVNPRYTINCNCGGGGYGKGDDQPPSFPPEPNPASDPPEGFDTWAQFWAYKCKASHLIVSNIKWYLDHFAGFSGTSALIGVIGAADLAIKSITTGAVLVMLAGDIALSEMIATLGAAIIAGAVVYWPVTLALTALAVGGVVGWSVLSDAAQAIEDNREVLACALYNSTPSTARTDFMSELNGIVDTWSTGSLISDLVDVLLPNDITNMLFTRIDSIDISAAQDCAGCGGCGTLYGQHTNREATFYSNNYWIFLSVADFGGEGDCPFQIENLSFSGFTPNNGFQYQMPGGNLTNMNEDLNSYSMEGVPLIVLQASCATTFTYSVNIIPVP